MNNIVCNILVVDDFEDIREGIKDILENIGHTVIVAENGIQAMKVINDKKVDMVITDILMPDMDGIELCTQIKKTYPNMIFILMSGDGRQMPNASEYNYLRSAQKLTGIDDILKKPFNPYELIELINLRLGNNCGN
ncbi:MAG: response regulator [Pseudomonadota bacterium]